MARPELLPVYEDTPLPDSVTAFAELVYGTPPDALDFAAARLRDPETEPAKPPAEALLVVGAARRLLADRLDADFDFDPDTEHRLRQDPEWRKLQESRAYVRNDDGGGGGHRLVKGAQRGRSPTQKGYDKSIGDVMRPSRLGFFVAQVSQWRREETSTGS